MYSGRISTTITDASSVSRISFQRWSSMLRSFNLFIFWSMNYFYFQILPETIIKIQLIVVYCMNRDS